MKWRCLRCKALFDDTDKKCYCTVSPSPWVPLSDPITDSERLDWFENNSEQFRYSGTSTITMDGKYPCWSVWTPKEGRTTRKTLREAIDASMDL